MQRICEDRGKAVPTSALQMIDLSREVAEVNRNNAKLMDCNIYLVLELNESRASKRLARNRVQKADARGKALEEHVESSDSNHSKTVEYVAQLEKKLCMGVTSLESGLKSVRRLAESVRRTTGVEEEAKFAVEMWANTRRQVMQLAKTVEDAPRWLTDSSRRVELLEEEAQGLKSQLGKMKKMRDSVAAKSSSW